MCTRGAVVLIYSVKHFQIYGTAIDRQLRAKAVSNKILLSGSKGQEEEFQHPRDRGTSSLELHHLNDTKKILRQNRIRYLNVKSGGHKALSTVC